MRTRKLILTAVGVAAVPGLLIYAVTWTSLYGALLKLFGTPVLLLIAIVLLIGLIAAAIFSVAYGFGVENPLRRSRRDRRNS
jgi:hypothetical protein